MTAGTIWIWRSPGRKVYISLVVCAPGVQHCDVTSVAGIIPRIFNKATGRALSAGAALLLNGDPINLALAAVEPTSRVGEITAQDMGRALFANHGAARSRRCDVNTMSVAIYFYGVFLHITRDRKSTRLNSSHVKISYAVFCLKKKKKK